MGAVSPSDRARGAAFARPPLLPAPPGRGRRPVAAAVGVSPAAGVPLGLRHRPGVPLRWRQGWLGRRGGGVGVGVGIGGSGSGTSGGGKGGTPIPPPSRASAEPPPPPPSTAATGDVDDGPFSILGVPPPDPDTYARRAAGPPARPPPGAVEVLDFVTQRAVQTYLFYRRSFRDSVTADWVEAATGLGPLGEVHDFVFRGTDRYLRSLGALPPRTVHVQTRVACQGGSAHNPYRPVKYIGYDVAVNPPAVVTSVCGVREGVAAEVIADLGRVGAENERLWGAYLVGVVRPEDVAGGEGGGQGSSSGGSSGSGSAAGGLAAAQGGGSGSRGGGGGGSSGSDGGGGGGKRPPKEVEGGLVERSTLPVNEHDPSHSGRSALCGGTADLVSKYVTVAAVWRVVGALEARGGWGAAVGRGAPVAADDEDEVGDVEDSDDDDDGGVAGAGVPLPPGSDDATVVGDGAAAPPTAAGAGAATADGGDGSADAPGPPPPPPRVLPGGGTVWGAGLDWEGARLDATWLRAFIAARGGGFEADAGYHVGRTFLKALLAQPPVIVTAPPTAAAADGALSPPDGPGGDADDATRAAAASATAANAAPATPATSASGGAAERPADSSSDGGLEEDAAGAPAGAVARGGFHMVDTRRLAQAVLTERLAVAAEWKAALAGVPAEHAALRRELLQKSLDASA